MAATTVQLRVYRLDDNTVRYELLNLDGTQYDLTGCSARLRLFDTKGGTLELTKTITETLDPAQGQIVAPSSSGVMDFFLNATDFPASGASPTDWRLESENPPFAYMLGTKLKTSAGKYHTLHDGGLGWILEVFANDF